MYCATVFKYLIKTLNNNLDNLKYHLQKDIVKIMFSSFFHADIYFDMPINI